MRGSEKTKSRALKNDGKMSNCFFKAFLLGVAVSGISLVVLCIAVSGFMSSKQDSTANMGIVSPVILMLSLVIGGFVCGKLGRGQGIAASFLCGCACLGLCYGLSVMLNLGGTMGNLHKSLSVAIMLISPVIGAKISSRQGDVKRRVRRGKA